MFLFYQNKFYNLIQKKTKYYLKRNYKGFYFDFYRDIIIIKKRVNLNRLIRIG